ncbi:Uncharacterised protein [Mycobacterium tuberculosis]|uniref:hypothetical protein n=1 Tax=Mycobacterium tuberculosis TaxID=1773 RepID=UPI0002D31F6A|nr:hypothetical protein [Mycobacterium tuberculosis]COW97511.1 Uncharacterised protein [Mycobacterium tuberculosis]
MYVTASAAKPLVQHDKSNRPASAEFGLVLGWRCSWCPSGTRGNGKLSMRRQSEI